MPTSSSTLPTVYLPHGGGPCFFMDWTMGPPDTWQRMGAWLGSLGATLGARPTGIVVISAHWEEPEFTVQTHPQPPLLFDYSGFPEHTYRLTWPAPGAPALAQRVRELLAGARQATGEDPERGFDHGVFVPFKLIYPDAAIPTIQLSLKAGLDPAVHLAAGRALEPLRREGVLIAGSGMSYHNMGGFFTARADATSRQFDAWLTAAAEAPDAAARNAALARWATAPAARQAHPREEHLLPLMVVAGAAGADLGKRVFSDQVMGAVVSAFQYGEAAA